MGINAHHVHHDVLYADSCRRQDPVAVRRFCSFPGKFGKSIEGSGGQFEEGFMAMGALGLAMVGMTALAPVLAHVLGPVIIPVYEMLGANPSMFAGTLLACDMGGFSSSPKSWRAAT